MSEYKTSCQLSIQDGNSHTWCTEASAGVKSGLCGSSAEAKIGSSVYRYNDGVGDLKIMSGGFGAKARSYIDGIGAKFEAGLNLVEIETGGFKSKIGVSADTGASFRSNGVEAKVAGFGVKVGKEMGFSTPIGEVSFDLEKVFSSWF